MQRPLFDRPCSRDTLLRMYVVLVALASLWSARGRVDLGGRFNPERAGALVNEATGWALALLLLVLLSALGRRLVRDEVLWRDGGPPPSADPSDAWYDPCAGSQGSSQGPPPTASRHTQRGRGWTNAAALRAHVTGSRTGPDAGEDERPARPPRAPEVDAVLDEVHTIVGLPVQLTWETSNADHVLISALDGRQPPSGTAAVHLSHGTDLTVTAVNEFGSRTVRTPYVTVYPLPALTALALPETPRIDLTANVSVSAGAVAPVLSRLDAVLDQQARLRAERTPDLMTFATAVSLVRHAAGRSTRWVPSGATWLVLAQEGHSRTRRLLVRSWAWSRNRAVAAVRELAAHCTALVAVLAARRTALVAVLAARRTALVAVLAARRTELVAALAARRTERARARSAVPEPAAPEGMAAWLRQYTDGPRPPAEDLVRPTPPAAGRVDTAGWWTPDDHPVAPRRTHS